LIFVHHYSASFRIYTFQFSKRRFATSFRVFQTSLIHIETAFALPLVKDARYQRLSDETPPILCLCLSRFTPGTPIHGTGTQIARRTQAVFSNSVKTSTIRTQPSTFWFTACTDPTCLFLNFWLTSMRPRCATTKPFTSAVATPPANYSPIATSRGRTLTINALGLRLLKSLGKGRWTVKHARTRMR
jgi:hypothetical protein